MSPGTFISNKSTSKNLPKWKWRLSWKQIISGKYKEDDKGWHSQEVRDRYKVGLCKAQEELGDC